MVVASAGESIAEIWLRMRQFDPESLLSLLARRAPKRKGYWRSDDQTGSGLWRVDNQGEA